MPDIEMEDNLERQDSPDEQLRMENKLVNEEYKMWKKNCVFLYDFLYTRALHWPTLTTQWFPDEKKIDEYLKEHRLLIGTSTTNHEADDPDNYVMISSVELPARDAPPPDPADYNEETGEIGGHGKKKKPFEFRITQKMNHPGDVNKARYCPQNPNIIATMSGDGNAYIFDRTKHESQPKDRRDQFDIKLVGHEKEGYGLSWSPHVEGHLATGTEDKTVRQWDLNASFTKGSKKISPVRTHTQHTATVNDVAHHPIVPHWIGTVSDDLTLQIIDARVSDSTKVPFTCRGHLDAVNCLAFHPSWDTHVATGSADKTIALWDLRNPGSPVHRFEHHKDAIIKLEWMPQSKSILGSASYDRRIILWDLSQIGEEQSAEDAEEGPPELLFMHGGFTQRVCDFSWNKNEWWCILAAAEDNQLQVFEPASNLVSWKGSSTSKKTPVAMEEVEQ